MDGVNQGKYFTVGVMVKGYTWNYVASAGDVGSVVDLSMMEHNY